MKRILETALSNRIWPARESKRRRWLPALVALSVALGWTTLDFSVAFGQTSGSAFDVPQTRLAPLGSPSAQVYPPANGSVMPPGSSFDPYTGAAAGGYIQPYAQPPALGSLPSLTGSMFGTPAVGASGGIYAPAMPPTIYGTPVYGGLANQPPPMLDAGGLFGGSSYSIPPPAMPSSAYVAPPAYSYPADIYPSGTPSTLFPGGLMGSTASFSPQLNPYRLIQRARFRHAFINDGDSADALEINDTDVALAFAWPQFLFSSQPLFIAPSFSLHLWDGPESSTGADLPGNAYSAFLDFGWQSDPNQIFGAELGLSVGAFTAFDLFNDDSLRVLGKGLGTLRVTPVTTLKLGVYYYDRVDVKMLPAFGLFCRPNPFTKVDLFFPQPKYARYCSTIGTNDLWWYLAGDYGGGSWTINRETKGEDQVDINDIRIALGFEWGESQRMRAGLRTWFCEVGYVGNRELVYRHNPADNLSLSDTWMVRLGIGY